MTSISLPGASGSCFVRSVFTCWACVAVANPKIKLNTERMSLFMLCIASVLSVMCCDNRLNRSCAADTHLGSCGNLSASRFQPLIVMIANEVDELFFAKLLPDFGIDFIVLISCLLFGRETRASTTQSDPLLLPTRNGPCREDGALHWEYLFYRVQHPPP